MEDTLTDEIYAYHSGVLTSEQVLLAVGIPAAHKNFSEMQELIALADCDITVAWKEYNDTHADSAEGGGEDCADDIVADYAQKIIELSKNS